MATLKLAELLPDIFGIEVNTLIKDHITAQKMPSLPHALHDIIREYGRKLGSYGVDVAQFLSPERLEAARQHDQESRLANPTTSTKPDLSPIFPPQLLRSRAAGIMQSFAHVPNGWISFEVLRLIARYLEQGEEDFSPVAPLEPFLLDRIRRNCDQLTYITRSLELTSGPRKRRWWPRLLGRASEPVAEWTEVLGKTRQELLRDELRPKGLRMSDLDPQSLTRVRKVWEIGTERVLVQTTIEIDGDVVTRLGNDLWADRFAAHRESLLAAHRQGVGVSLRHWQSLVRVAVEIVGAAVGGIAASLRGR